jgi:hypothetical protein
MYGDHHVEGAKAFRVLDPAPRCMRVECDVMFDEGRGWAWDKAVDDKSVTVLHHFTVEYMWAGGAEEA